MADFTSKQSPVVIPQTDPSQSSANADARTVTATAEAPPADPCRRPLDTRRPFTRADALAAGISPAVLRGSRFRRIFTGVFIDSRVGVTDVVKALAALALHPATAYASHTSAAKVLRIPVPHVAAEHVSVFDKRDRCFRAGVRSHVSPSGVAVVKYRGVRVSDAAATFIALASMLDLVDLVVAGDAMVALGMVTEAELVAAAAVSTDRHVVAARRAASFVRRGVDSPMETRLRMLIVLAGLPEPQVNEIVRSADGRVQMRFDLSYPWLKLIVEYDGRQHADDPHQWSRDIERREKLDQDGWRLVIVTAKGVYREPEETLRRVAAGLRERGCEQLPRRLSDGWRIHFPTAR